MILADLVRDAGISYAWGRIFFLFGPYEDPRKLVASTILAYMNGDRPTCREPLNVNDLIYVEDAGEAFVALLDSEVFGPVNIGSGNPLRVGDISAMIADLMGLEVPRVSSSGPGLAPVRLIADLERLKREVGWSPNHDLRDGMQMTINWWRNRGSGNTSFRR
jgi:nucleoside-diphosphate-sugar epimerase